MDVVKTNIERIGGRAKLESKRNRGTTLWLEIPLTLATIPALTVVSGKSVFAVPQAALVELIALDSQNAQKLIESIDGVSVFRFRGTVVPLLSLGKELQLATAGVDAEIVKLVVVRAEGRQVALEVDNIRSTEEIVIKPLDKRFKNIALFSGATVLGDGRVALILDIPSFVRRAGVMLDRDFQLSQESETSQSERVSLLLLEGPNTERMAIPLDYVRRLEEFTPSAKEPMGELTVVQYRKEIVPITPLAELLDERRATKRTTGPPLDKISTVVLRIEGSRNAILEVHRILGIVKVELDNLTPPSRFGVRGSMVIQERVTELLDVPVLLTRCRRLEMAPVLVGAEAENLVVLCASIVIGLVMGIWMARIISRPIIAVKDVAERIAAGDLSGSEVAVRSEDEVGMLGHSVNKMQNNLRDIVQSISTNAQNVANASEEVSAASQQISANSEETSAQANSVSASTEQVNHGLQTVATATEEMSSSIQEIAKNATEAAKVADGAMKTASETNAIVAKLGESSAQIGQVIKVITSIAQKTDLLALNATVEAARAGEVGTGFAVVANEVKELAEQTATATEDISRKIETIQADAKSAVKAIASISEVIGHVNDISGTIATAVEEQSATTSEMSRNISEAAKGAGDVAQNIHGVAQAAQSTSHGATESQNAAKQLAQMSTQLQELVHRFRVKTNGEVTARA